MANIRIKNLPGDAAPSASDVVALDNATTRGSTIAQIADVGRPFASQAEAQAGTNTTKVMNPLTTVQSIAAQWTIALTSIGVTFPNNTLKADARDYLDVAPLAATRTILKALDTTKEQVAYLTEGERRGYFVFLLGDYSLPVVNDTLEGVYIKADAIASSVGAWVRVNFMGRLTPEMYGAVGTTEIQTFLTLHDDTAPMLAAISNSPVGGDVYLAKTYYITSWINFPAVKFTGPGRILTFVNAGVVGSSAGMLQMNWGRDANQLIIGEEYLTKIRRKLGPSYAGVSRNLKTYFHGDSTGVDANTFGVLDPNNWPTNALANIAARLSLPGTFNVTNNSVSGQRLEDQITAILANVKEDPGELGTAFMDVLFINFGRNEAFQTPFSGRVGNIDSTLSTVASKWRTYFNSIRTKVPGWGALEHLSIVNIGPNAMDDTGGVHDTMWLEAWYPYQRQICREFNILDLSQYWRWPDAAASGQKLLYLDSAVLHPNDEGWRFRWSAIETALGDALRAPNVNTNDVINPPSTVATMPFATLPDSINPGIKLYYAGTGWGENGVVFCPTSGNKNNQVQMFFPDGKSIIRTRKRNIAANTWTALSGVAQVFASFQNSWVAFTGQTPGFRLTNDGDVVMWGAISTGTVTAGTVVAQLPVGWRPQITHDFICAANGGNIRWRIFSNGNIALVSAGDATFSSFDGIRFPAFGSY